MPQDPTAPVPFGIYTNRQKLDDQPIMYTSFSGTDISAQVLMPNEFEDKPLHLGELQTISYSMHRESKPVRVLGRVSAKGFVRGPRCIPASGKVYIKDRGYISIADVKMGDYVQSSGFTFDKVLGSYNQGHKLCYKLKLKDGFEITTSYDHPIFTDRGWVSMEDLTLEDKVHIAGYCPSPQEEYEISDDILKILALLIGDGTTRRYKKKKSESHEHRIGLAIAHTELATIGATSASSLDALGIPYRDTESIHGGCLTRTISVCEEGKAKTDWRLRKYNTLHESLLKFGMYDKYSYNKFIPQELIAGLNKRQIAFFLSHLFATDGGYSLEKNTNRLRVTYLSTSEELIDEIRLLLNKLGISSLKRLDRKAGAIGGRVDITSRHNAYKLIVSNRIDVLKFYNRIGIFGKDDRIKHLIPDLYKGIRSELLQVETKTFLTKAQDAIKENGLNPSDFKASCNIYNYKAKGVGVTRALRVAKIIGNTRFTLWVNSLIDDLINNDHDFKSKSIQSIEKLIELPVYDLEVENRHSFVCDFIKVHNTIAGSMIFTTFNSYAFYRLAQFKQLVYGSPTDNRPPMFPLADMLPPFDIVLTFSNEYGSFARMKIMGITIVDEGGTMSIEDLISEQTFTFMAIGIQPLTSYVPEATYGLYTPEKLNKIRFG